MSSARPTSTTWTSEPTYDEYGRRICGLDGCSRPHSAKGLCSMHAKRVRSHGDPTRKSRFATEEEKAAFIAADIAARRQRRERNREQYQAEQEQLRLWMPSAIRKTRPVADALMGALDKMNEAERSAALELLVTTVLGTATANDTKD